LNSQFPEVQKLLRLKRYEQPSEEYFEEFLDEFHRRQREDLMRTSSRRLFAERLAVWFRELGMAKWAYGAGLAYATLMVGFLMWPRGGSEEIAQPGIMPLPGERVLEHVDFEEAVPAGGNPAMDSEEEVPPQEF
jgi:hypothetical protein